MLFAHTVRRWGRFPSTLPQKIEARGHHRDPIGIGANPGHIPGSRAGVGQRCPAKALRWLEGANGLETNAVRLREELEENFCCLRM